MIQAGHLLAPQVLAQSSQVFTRNYNGIAAPLIAGPVPLAYHHPYHQFRHVHAAPLLRSAPFAQFSPIAPLGLTPYGAAAAIPYARYPGHFF